MPHLPNEIWLQIVDYCDPLDIWLSLRRVNSQLSLCAEQHFRENFLPDAVLSLPIALPTYDMRNPMKGKATFKPVQSADSAPSAVDDTRMILSLVETEPDYYLVHFLSRWKGMQSSKGGQLNDRMQWELALCGRSSVVHLKDPLAEVRDDGAEGEATVSFEWRCTVTSFLRDYAEMVRSIGRTV